MKKLLLPALLAVTAVAPASVQAEPGELDRSFGSGGRVITPAPLPVPWSQARVEVATTPAGDVVVAGDGQLLRYREDGQLDSTFGTGGVAPIRAPANLRFALGDLGIDADGRIVLIGTARDAKRSFAAIFRYLPEGVLDPSFGGGDGLVLDDFGIGGSQGPAAAAASLGAVDSQGHITLIAGTLKRRPICGSQPHLHRRDLLIARLTPEGRLDLGFGNLGKRSLQPLERVEAMAFDPEGGVALAGSLRDACGEGPHMALIRFRFDGVRVGDFGTRGARHLTGTPASIAFDANGRIVVLCRARQMTARDEQATKVVRLLPDGRFDRSFRGGWVAYITKGPRYDWHTVAIRPGKKPILVGTLIRPSAGADHRRFHRWFLAVPLRESGRLEDNVSWRGWAWITRFDADTDAAAAEALIDTSGRLLIAGTARRPKTAPAGGYAIAAIELE